MEIVYRYCAGLDIRKKAVNVCLINTDENGHGRKAIRAYAPKTKDLLAMRDWLKDAGCTLLGMEAKGQHWEAIYNLLEEDFALLVVDARYFKTVPARGADVKDAEWLATLLRYGLLKAIFTPSPPQRKLRELTRERSYLVEQRARKVNQLQKTLKDTNIKLTDVVSDLLDKPARAILQALVNGETNPGQLASLEASQNELERALTGEVTAHHQLVLSELLKQIDDLDAAIEQTSQQIVNRLPFA